MPSPSVSEWKALCRFLTLQIIFSPSSDRLWWDGFRESNQKWSDLSCQSYPHSHFNHCPPQGVEGLFSTVVKPREWGGGEGRCFFPKSSTLFCALSLQFSNHTDSSFTVEKQHNKYTCINITAHSKLYLQSLLSKSINSCQLETFPLEMYASLEQHFIKYGLGLRDPQCGSGTPGPTVSCESTFGLYWSLNLNIEPFNQILCSRLPGSFSADPNYPAAAGGGPQPDNEHRCQKDHRLVFCFLFGWVQTDQLNLL